MAVLIERGFEHVFQWLRIRNLLQLIHTLVIVESVGLHIGHRLVSGLTLLGTQHLLGVFERGLGHGNHVQRIGVGLGVQQFERGQQERGERLVEGEVVRHIKGHVVVLAAVLAVLGFDDFGIEQGLENLVGPLVQMLLLVGGLRGIVDEIVDTGTGVAALRHFVEHHRMRDFQVRDQGFRFGVDELVKRALVPGHKTFRSLLALDLLELLRVSPGLGDGLLVFDFVFGSLGDHQSLGIESHTTGSSGNLVEFTGAQAAHLGAVELGQGREHHGVNRHIDADAQCIGAANHRQQTLLGELLDQAAVAWQHAGMMDADTGAQQSLQNLAEGCGELDAFDGFCDGLALFLAGYTGGGERLRGLQCGVLRKVDHVNRGFAVAEGEFHGFFHRVERVFVAQRHRSRRVGDYIHVRGVVQIGELVGDGVHIAERGAHQQELGLRQREQWHLPRPTALRITVIMEFVYRHKAHVGMGAFAQSLIGEDFGGAADDRRVRVDVAVAGDHADVVAAEHFDQVEEFLRHQRLDRSGVIGAAASA